MSKRTLQVGLVVFLIGLMTNVVSALEVTVGTQAEPAIDPHFLWLDTNVAYNSHIFDTLTGSDEDAKMQPGLALSWKPMDNNLTWEFKLRRGVKFHDGSDLTAEDVVFSINRIPKVPNNTTPYTQNVRSIVGMEIVDSHTVRLKTEQPDPVLPNRMRNVSIVSKKVAESATTADFKSGKAAIGTGPYKFAQYVPGDRYVLVRNDEYWGQRPAYDRVTFRIITENAAQ